MLERRETMAINTAPMARRLVAGTTLALMASAALTTVPVRAAGPRAIDLQIRKVVAKDECGGVTEWGHDRMTLAAVVVQNGTAKVRTLALGNFGHDGSKRVYDPAHTFHTFKVTPGVVQRFQAYLVLAERDVQGGFGDYLAKFAERVPKGLSAPKKGSNGAELDANAAIEAGTAIAATGLTAGTAIAIGKQVLKELGARLTDDIFTHHLEEIVVKADGSFNQAELAPRTQIFRAKDCAYTVTYQWSAR
jgi:hypothetical protein